LTSLIAILIFSQLHHFGFTTITSPQTAGISFPITVYAYDSLNNIVDFDGVAVIFATPGPQYGDTTATFTDGVWQGQFTVTLADTLSVSCQDYNVPPHTGSSNSVVFQANSAYKLLTILPGQVYYPGIENGKAGSPIAQRAGVSFSGAVYYTDRWSNLITSGNDSYGVSSTDQYTGTQTFVLTNGTGVFSYALRTAGSHHLYTRDNTNGSIKTDTSSQFMNNPGDYSDLLIILPGETHEAGDTTTTTADTPGKTGIPDDQYEGEDFSVTVYATDSMWNVFDTTGPAVQLNSDFLFSNPAPVNFNNGAVQFTIQFNETGRVLLWAEEYTIRSNNNYLNIVSQIDTTVVPDSFIAYPNPMGIEGNRMYFAYYLSSSCNVIFAIYDPFGNLVYKQEISPGNAGAQSGLNRISWNGRNGENERVASGLYYAIIKGWTHTATIFNERMKVGVVW
jgi:hypothetical protein